MQLTLKDIKIKKIKIDGVEEVIDLLNTLNFGSTHSTPPDSEDDPEDDDLELEILDLKTLNGFIKMIANNCDAVTDDVGTIALTEDSEGDQHYIVAIPKMYVDGTNPRVVHLGSFPIVFEGDKDV